MSMEKTLQELADFLHGTLENEDPALRITGVNGLVEAGPTEISFAIPPYVEFCHKSRAGAMILAPEDRKLDRPVIRVSNPKQAFAELLELFRPREEVARVISPLAYVAEDARIGKNVAIQPFAVVEAGAEIGDNTVIYAHAYIGRHVKVGSDCVVYPNVTVRENCIVGNRNILQSGCVIGGDGFGFVSRPVMWYWATMWKSAAIPVSTERRLAAPSWATGQNWIIWCIWDITMWSGKITCS